MKTYQEAPTISQNSSQAEDSFFEEEYWFLVLLLVLTIIITGLKYLFKKLSSQSQAENLNLGKTISSGNRGFSNSTGNHCFANALLICLYYLPGFKQQIHQAAKNSSSNLILKRMKDLFETIDNSSDNRLIEEKKEEFFQEVRNENHEVII